MNPKFLIKELLTRFRRKSFLVSSDEEFDILHIYDGLAMVFIENKSFYISFEVNCDPTLAAFVTQEVLILSECHNMSTSICEPYANVENENGELDETFRRRSD